MAVKIRLQRKGAKHDPVYRLVAADARAKRDGRFIEILGTYSPKARKREDELTLKLERIDYWLGEGAQPSDTARSLINRVRRGSPAEAAPAVKETAPAAEEAAPAVEAAPEAAEATPEAEEKSEA